MKLLPILLGLLLLSALIAESSIEWEKKEITVAVHPVQLKKEVTFNFRNTGTNPVEFLSIRPSCGCVSIHLKKKRYLPGESGSLNVEFNLETRTGSQKKSIEIITSDKPKRTQSLYLKVDIPEAFQFSTRRLIWASGREPSTQTVTLTNVSSEAISLGKITSSNERLKVVLKILQEGFEYRLELTPETDLENTRAVIRIATIPPAGMRESKSYKIYTWIK